MRPYFYTFLFALVAVVTCSFAAISMQKVTHRPAAPDSQLEESEPLRSFFYSCVTVLTEKQLKVGPLKMGAGMRVTGAGVVVKAHYAQPLLILTAAHVAKTLPDTGVVHIWNKGTPLALRVHVKVMAEEYDLALLETDFPWEGPDIAVTLATTEPGRGSGVWVVGSPGGIEWNVSHGVLSSKKPCGNDAKGLCYRTDATIYFGNSGGGVFNESGELIGIADYVEVDQFKDNDGDPHDLIIPGSGGVISLASVRGFLKLEVR